MPQSNGNAHDSEFNPYGRDEFLRKHASGKTVTITQYVEDHDLPDVVKGALAKALTTDPEGDASVGEDPDGNVLEFRGQTFPDKLYPLEYLSLATMVLALSISQASPFQAAPPVPFPFGA